VLVALAWAVALIGGVAVTVPVRVTVPVTVTVGVAVAVPAVTVPVAHGVTVGGRFIGVAVAVEVASPPAGVGVALPAPLHPAKSKGKANMPNTIKNLCDSRLRRFKTFAPFAQPQRSGIRRALHARLRARRSFVVV
jgi:hypothetical protein